MRFLLDQDVYAITMKFLRDLGHDVIPVAQLGLSKADDSDLLEEAQKQDRILVTRDRDFGSLVFVSGLGTGVIYLHTPKKQHFNIHRNYNEGSANNQKLSLLDFQ